MDQIDEKKFNKTKVPEEKEPIELHESITNAEFSQLLDEMKNPVDAQRQMAVKIKLFLDERIKAEMKEKKYLSDHTRRWVEQFNKILDSIQKSLYGDKSVNLHVHKVVSHSDIATKIRKAQQQCP